MDFININGYNIPYPNDFTMKREPRIVAEYEVFAGDTITVGDASGWKYADTTLQWDTLLDEDLQNLLAATIDYTFTITFKEIDGEHTTTAVKRSSVSTKTPLQHNGQLVWQNIQIALSFPECYH